MIIKALLILNSIATAQVPQQSKIDKQVNEHLQKTNKKIEIEGQQKEIELKKDAPVNLKSEPASKKKNRFIVSPGKEPQDTTVYRDQYDHNNSKDPSTEFEQAIIEERVTPSEEATNKEYIRQFKENAAKAGVKVEIDSKTLKARPVNSNGTN